MAPLHVTSINAVTNIWRVCARGWLSFFWCAMMAQLGQRVLHSAQCNRLRALSATGASSIRTAGPVTALTLCQPSSYIRPVCSQRSLTLTPSVREGQAASEWLIR